MQNVSKEVSKPVQPKPHQHFCIDCDGPYSCCIPKPAERCYLENAERCLKHYLAFVRDHGI